MKRRRTVKPAVKVKGLDDTQWALPVGVDAQGRLHPLRSARGRRLLPWERTPERLKRKLVERRIASLADFAIVIPGLGRVDQRLALEALRSERHPLARHLLALERSILRDVRARAERRARPRGRR